MDLLFAVHLPCMCRVINYRIVRARTADNIFQCLFTMHEHGDYNYYQCTFDRFFRGQQRHIDDPVEDSASTPSPILTATSSELLSSLLTSIFVF